MEPNKATTLFQLQFYETREIKVSEWLLIKMYNYECIHMSLLVEIVYIVNSTVVAWETLIAFRDDCYVH